MFEKAVINASPLILLVKAGFDDILPKLFKEIYVSESVLKEVFGVNKPMKELPSFLKKS